MQLSRIQSSLAERLDAAPSPGITPETGLARPLRIALVTEYYYPHLGGVCEHVHYFAREARLAGHHVDVITSRINGARSSANVIRIGRSQPVYANGSMARMSIGFGLRRAMRQVLRDGGYDVVHVHSPLTPILPLLAVEEATVPLIGTFHTYFTRSIGYELGHRYFESHIRRLDAAIAVSPSAVQALSQYFDTEWRVIPNGIDLDEFKAGGARPVLMRPDVPTILFLHRLDPRNGLAHLIPAFRQVRARGRAAQLVVVGNGPLRSHYEGLARGEPNITFAGAVHEGRPAYYSHSSVYACPITQGASFGITLLEAMACETPIVCSRIPGFRDVVTHEKEALMVPPGDSGALADAIIRLLDDETLRARMGKTGRETAERYGWPAVTASVLGVYADVLRASSR
jgi:phosphatidylinositol alpha-mannosyltransferase